MSAVYNGGGIYLRGIEICQADGGPPDAADVDAFFAPVAPVAGAWATVTIANQPDVPRNVTFLVTDGDASITSGYLEVIGTDAQDRALQETLSFAGGGTGTVVGTKCFKTITSSRYIVAGAVGGGDTVQGGYGDVLGVPYDIAATSDVKNRRQDGNAAVGTISIIYQYHGTWTLSGGNVPNAARRFYLDVQSTAS